MRQDALRPDGPDGLSLVELLITMGVLGVVAVGTARLMSSSMSSQKGVELSSQLLQFSSGLQQILGVQASCKANLAGVAFDSTLSTLQVPALQIHYPQFSGGTVTKGAVFAKAGTLINGWNVTSLGLKIMGQPGPDTFLMQIEAVLAKQPGVGGAATSYGAQTSAPQTTLVTVKTSGTAPNKVIDDCSAASSGGSLLSFESALQAFPQPGESTIFVPHGMGKAPSLIRVAIVCATADLGYPVGAELTLSSNNTVWQPGWTVVSDATYVGIIFSGTATDPIKIHEFTGTGMDGKTHTMTNFDYSKWRLKFVAYANP
jgi:prepilin-type N-terminal cleavage/methylation domain-containing protein